MRVVLSWLRELCPVDLGVEELAELLSAKGLHVEEVLRPWEGLSGVVVARVLEVADHPDSDRLCLARVDAGGAVRQVVVGVRNMRPGDLVPYAGPGARVPAVPEPLAERRIRGVTSQGMLCSPRELGISPDHSAILVLDDGLAPGAPLKEALGLDETVLDLEIETNRPDLLSVVGVAREVSAATGAPLALLEDAVEEAEEEAAAQASVEVLDPARCPRYLARVVRGVRVGPSPVRVQARLTAAGMRPVSNVVDATNYVMLELGHPMHPFDLERLEGRTVVVRTAREGERLVTLDGVERVLTADDLVIADRSRAVGIAGVMGSAREEVSPTTTAVLLESAYFEPRGIFRTSRRLQLQTEASTRFSRGADPEALGPAAARACRLMVEWAGGQVLRGAIDVGRPPRRRRLTLRPSRASRVLGYEVTAAEAADALGRVGISSEKADHALRVEVPSHRPDLLGEIDLIEEIVRVQGYDALPSRLPPIRQPGGEEEGFARRRRIREALVRAGLREALSLSFASRADVELVGREGVRVANPPSAEEPYLRPSLLPGLLRALSRNADRGARGAALFEVGRVFAPGDPVEEREAVAAVLWGAAGAGIHAERRPADFFDAKGALEAVLEALGVAGWDLGEPPGRPFHPARSAQVSVAGRAAGVVGELHPAVAERLDLPGRVAAFEVDVEAVAAGSAPPPPARELPRFPPVRRDLAFVVDREVPAAAVREAIASSSELVDEVVLFDVFTGPPVPEGRKSLAFSVDLRAPDRTLTDREAEAAVGRIVERLRERFGAELRAG